MDDNNSLHESRAADFHLDKAISHIIAYAQETRKEFIALPEFL